MNTTSLGRTAENQAAKWLKLNYNYQLISKNWRTRTCEIDLIMQEGAQTIHFIEVKYRKNHTSGAGLESISKAKLTRMYNAAQEWIQQQPNSSNLELNIAAIELTGASFKVSHYIQSIIFDY
jgi:uncharacterized protein (TIGR00252 family)